VNLSTSSTSFWSWLSSRSLGKSRKSRLSAAVAMLGADYNLSVASNGDVRSTLSRSRQSNSVCFRDWPHQLCVCCARAPPLLCVAQMAGYFLPINLNNSKYISRSHRHLKFSCRTGRNPGSERRGKAWYLAGRQPSLSFFLSLFHREYLMYVHRYSPSCIVHPLWLGSQGQ